MSFIKCPACPRLFEPVVAWQKCCSDKCADRMRHRVYDAKHRTGRPVGRPKKKPIIIEPMTAGDTPIPS